MTSINLAQVDTPLAVFNAANAVDRRTWLDLWSRWPEREPVAHPGYLKAIAAPGERPMCAALDLGDRGVLYPFMMRRVNKAPSGSAVQFTDITGPLFGYTGAFHWNVDERTATRFWSEFSTWAHGEHVVSSFARLSLFGEDLLPFPGRTRVVQPNVIRDLQLADDALWDDVEHKVRKNVKRAHSEGVVVDADPMCAQLADFIKIYSSTMQRRHASDRYHFDRAFFETLVTELQDAIQLYVARVDTGAVAAELVLTSAHHAYSFLGGTLESGFSLRPNDLLKYEIIRSLRDQGLTHYVLGGGPEPSDGIFRYKRSFAPRGVVDFKVAEQVHDPGVYEMLVQQRSLRAAAEGKGWTPAPEFFPAYRAG